MLKHTIKIIRDYWKRECAEGRHDLVCLRTYGNGVKKLQCLNCGIAVGIGNNIYTLWDDRLEKEMEG
jgi:hypothetical protein